MFEAAALAAMFIAQVAGAQAGALTPPERYGQCVAQVEADPDAGYETAMVWANETNDLYAFRCAALALIEQGRHEQGARRLESLGAAADGFDAYTRASLFSQAGHAWLLAHDPGRARSAFTRTIAALGSDQEALPEALIDRAIAYGEEGDDRRAEEDLSRALDLKPDDALALRLRALARMRQNSFDLALADANAALALEPTNVEAAVVLGHVRESQRIGRPVDEDGGGE